MRQSSHPVFGKYFLTSFGTILNYFSYDYFTTPKVKIINTTGLTDLTLSDSIVATSTNFDCAVTYVAGSILSTYKINTNDTTAIEAYDTVIA